MFVFRVHELLKGLLGFDFIEATLSLEEVRGILIRR